MEAEQARECDQPATFRSLCVIAGTQSTVYLRGMAFLQLHHRDGEAAAELTRSSTIKPRKLEHLLARSRAWAWQKATSAPKPYKDFLNAWKDA